MQTMAMLLAALLLAGSLRADRDGEARVALLPSVEAAGAVLHLAELLPPAAPEWLRNAARDVKIADAPEPGLTRRLSRRDVIHASGSSTRLLSHLLIPETIALRRRSRQVSRAEIASLLRSSGAGELDLARIRVPRIQVPATAELRLKQSRYDRLQRRTLVSILAAEATPGIAGATLVLASVSGEVVLARREEAPAAANELAEAAPRRQPPPARAPWAARRRQPATALLEMPGLRISQTVVPLRDGAIGEVIPVQEPGGGATRSALVIGPGRLRLTQPALGSRTASGR